MIKQWKKVQESHSSILKITEGHNIVCCPTHDHKIHFKSDAKLEFASNWSLYKEIGPIIKEIRFNSCQLESLPNDFFDCLENLEILYLNGNRLKSLPSPTNPHPLQQLYAHNNKITSLDLNNFQTLGQLSISENPLQEFPSSLFNLSQLTVLMAGQIGLKAIPEDIAK